MKLIDKFIYKFKKRYYGWKLKRFVINHNPSIDSFRSVLSQYKAMNCFIHGGSKNIESFFGSQNGLDKLMELLDANFDNILTPAYTLSFKKNGVYHKKYSKPDIGYFGVLFERFASFRSNDPIGSIWVRGKISQNDNIDLQNSFFASNGLYGIIDNSESVTICLGTNTVMLSLLHYLEEKFKVPYRKKVVYNGVIYFDDHDFRHISHTTTENISILHLERERVEYDMLKEGVLKRYDFGNFVFRIMNNKEFSNFIDRKTSKDPYYLFYEKK
jgi:aminoglycoside N3'-acetyltransferase